MEDYFLSEWNDDERMIVLMTALPVQKESLSCQSRLNFWSSAIHKWTTTKKLLSFTLQEAEVAFQRGSQVPLCLQDVLSHMLKKGELLTVDQLLEDSKNTWFAWTKKNLLVLPSQWTMKRLKQPFTYGSQESTVYVVTACLKTTADYFLNEYWSTSEKKCTHVTSMSSLHHLLSKMVLKIEDYNLIIQYLTLLGKVCHTINDGQIVVKFGTPGQVEILPISEIEIASFRLTSAKETIEERIKQIINEMNICRSEAKSLLKSGFKKQALNNIRRKQMLEHTLESVNSTHDNLIICIEKLQESEINREVIGAFNCGLNALKKSVAPIDSVEDTLDNLKEVIDEYNDITTIISTAVDPLDVSEDDLEKELIRLMEDISLKPSFEKPSLPDAPSNIPTKIGESEKA